LFVLFNPIGISLYGSFSFITSIPPSFVLLDGW